VALQAEIRQLMRANVIPGAVVLIRSPRRGDWSAAFGTRALGTRALGTSEPMTLADHFRVGSNTKTVTATVILQLVQEGKLRLDDPVAKHVAGVPNGERITIANQLDPAMQRLRLVSIRPTEPGNPAGAGYGLRILRTLCGPARCRGATRPAAGAGGEAGGAMRLSASADRARPARRPRSRPPAPGR
jgi:hypothetical protein